MNLPVPAGPLALSLCLLASASALAAQDSHVARDPWAGCYSITWLNPSTGPEYAELNPVPDTLWLAGSEYPSNVYATADTSWRTAYSARTWLTWSAVADTLVLLSPGTNELLDIRLWPSTRGLIGRWRIERDAIAPQVGTLIGVRIPCRAV